MFPREELFGLSSQMRRAGVSVASNIAEGHGRGTPGEFKQFPGIANGCVAELQTQSIIARGPGYATGRQLDECDSLAVEVSKMLSAFIPTIKNPKPK
jgi:four helix bundle protein